MAVPKKKPSRTRTRRRSATYDKKKQVKMLGMSIATCHQCGEYRMSHAVCKECGAYSATYKLDRTKKQAGDKAPKKEKKKTATTAGPQATKSGDAIERAKAAQGGKSTFFRRKSGAA